MVLVSKVIYQNHVVKGSSSFGWESLKVSRHPTRLVAVGTMVLEMKCF